MDDKVRAKMLEVIGICDDIFKNKSGSTIVTLMAAVYRMGAEQDLVDRRPAPTAKQPTWQEAKDHLAYALDLMSGAKSGYECTDDVVMTEVANMQENLDGWGSNTDDHEDEMRTRNQKS